MLLCIEGFAFLTSSRAHLYMYAACRATSWRSSSAFCSTGISRLASATAPPPARGAGSGARLRSASRWRDAAREASDGRRAESALEWNEALNAVDLGVSGQVPASASKGLYHLCFEYQVYSALLSTIMTMVTTTAMTCQRSKTLDVTDSAKLLPDPCSLFQRRRTMRRSAIDSTKRGMYKSMEGFRIAAVPITMLLAASKRRCDRRTAALPGS
mmetsp:Transcript_53662/g.153074  ORF Transcript_53662/g.153074 Transcript_53662/m.153074 type:complete len:213 (-) Transcript_53662:1200-1838(-)